ncbi:hypothetical protein CRUP_000133 [Coryphaenoides rupestris]|nr:hypothetical protein CRUP_000133 [Coryphaenoides rupestris]
MVKVKVADGPVTTRQCTVCVRVHVSDQNDNPPRFAAVAYRVRVPERDRSSRRGGDPVTRLVAYDRDLGANGNITYSIVDGNQEGRFLIDGRTGAVASRRAAAAGSVDVLTVRAEDGGDPALWSTVALRVEWIRRPTPSTLPLVFTQRNYTFSVPETAAVSQLVGVVSLRYPGSPLWFSITGSLTLDPQLGVGTIMVSRPLDAELQSVYNMTIQVTDGTRVATAQVCIRVLDTNDNPPVFSQPAYDLVVSEVAAPGTALLRLRALDADERSRLSFSLQAAVDPASVRLFRVHAATGTLYTAGPLDYETRTQHILTVMVKDQEAPFHRDLARVLVAVEDSNDNAPSFSAASYHGTVVSGSTPAGTAVLQVTAFDPDSGVNGQLTYSIEAGNADGRFAIGNSSGVIYAAGSSDAATAWGSYLLTVRVTDAGEPPLTATASAHIVVMPPDVSTATFAQREYQAEVREEPAG